MCLGAKRWDMPSTGLIKMLKSISLWSVYTNPPGLKYGVEWKRKEGTRQGLLGAGVDSSTKGVEAKIK